MTNHTTSQAVLFDLDGTLIDTAPDFIRIIQQICQQYAYSMPTDKQIREQVSAGARAMVKLLLNTNGQTADDALIDKYRQEFLNLYQNEICLHSQLFNGLDDLLYTLEQHQIAWGIVTNKPRHLAQLLLQKLNLHKRCAVLVCPDDVRHSKPHPEPMFLAIQRLNDKPNTHLTAQNCVYVGDHIRDIQAGNRAGMTTVAAAYGYITPEDKDIQAWGANAIIHHADELHHVLIDIGFNLYQKPSK